MRPSIIILAPVFLTNNAAFDQPLGLQFQQRDLHQPHPELRLQCLRACARVPVLACLCLCACARRACAVVCLCLCACACVFSLVLVRASHPHVPSVPSPVIVPTVPGVAQALRGWWAGLAQDAPFTRPSVRPCACAVLRVCLCCACAHRVPSCARAGLALAMCSCCACAVPVLLCACALCARLRCSSCACSCMCLIGLVCPWHAGVGCIGGLT